jgi:F420-dependent oxidoreductase-like protein
MPAAFELVKRPILPGGLGFVKLGLQLPSFTLADGPAALRERFATVARLADQAGFASIWVMDHFFQIGTVGAVDEPMLEGYSALSYLAAVTERARLGTLVTGVTYRHPGLLVKQVTTLDVLSGGRAIFGVGAAWNEREHLGLGVPFPRLKERFERLEETLRIAHQMWNGDAMPFDGKYYQLAEPLNFPRALSNPRPPIMIGGGGEQKTLRLVARYGDACNLFGRMGADVLRHKLDVLQDHCETEGRNYDEIDRTVMLLLAPGTADSEPSKVVDEMLAMQSLGFTTTILSLRRMDDVAAIERTFDALASRMA